MLHFALLLNRVIFLPFETRIAQVLIMNTLGCMRLRERVRANSACEFQHALRHPACLSCLLLFLF